jgi:hypothetical protein
MSPRGKWLYVLPIPIVLVTVGLMLIGLWAGMARMGISGVRSPHILTHGSLMVSAVLGTLICLERAVALIGVLPSRWAWLAFLAPFFNAIGGILLVTGWQDHLAMMLILLASGGLIAIFVVIMTVHPSTDTALMMLGAIALLVGNGLWFTGSPIFELVHWWIAFLILTIIGERLELSRIRKITPRQRWYLITIILFYFGSVVLTLVDLVWGTRLGGIGYILMAWWLFRYDIARITVQHNGLPKFVAICLLSGYVWMGIGGIIALWQGALYAGLLYEAFLHAILVGFVMSMIFGHAPIIIPALTGRSVQFNRILYVPLLLLHTSLILRIASDITLWVSGRQWGGIFNVVAILLFLAIMGFLVVFANIPQRPSATDFIS